MVTVTTLEFELAQLAEAAIHTVGGLTSFDESLEKDRNRI